VAKATATATAMGTATANATETAMETADDVGGGGSDTAIMATATTQA